MSRFPELILTAALLVVFMPAMLLIALAIRLDSRGPIFFRQQRIGKDGIPFSLLKFRKMREDLPKQGPMLSGRFDPRFTRIGRFLERTKLDEIPQLFNVLRGEMSLVGPRPEVPKFTQYYPEKWAVVLSVKPGAVGLNQVIHRNESELFPPDCSDIEVYYIQSILPAKLDLDIEYTHRRSLWFDLWILIRCVWATVLGTMTQRSFDSLRTYLAILSLDTLLSLASYYLAYGVRFSGQIGPLDRDILIRMLLPVCVIRALCFGLYRIPRHLPGYFSIDEVGVVLRSIVVGSLGILGFAFVANLRAHSRAILIVDTAFLAMMLLGYRWAWAWLRRRRHSTVGSSRVVIVGVNDETVWIIETLRRLGRKVCEIVGVVDTDATRRGHRIAGVEIIGLTGELDLLFNVHSIDAALVIRSAVPRPARKRIEQICREHNIQHVPLPGLLGTIEAAVAKPNVQESTSQSSSSNQPDREQSSDNLSG
ncbi:MAG: sugar transferase [bacterium]